MYSNRTPSHWNQPLGTKSRPQPATVRLRKRLEPRMGDGGRPVKQMVVSSNKGGEPQNESVGQFDHGYTCL